MPAGRKDVLTSWPKTPDALVLDASFADNPNIDAPIVPVVIGMFMKPEVGVNVPVMGAMLAGAVLS